MRIRELLVVAIASTLILSASALRALSTEAVASIPEEIEWTWEVRPTHVDRKLPSVLLIGDSITRNYYPGVVRRLAGKANVYLMATSACIGDPRLPAQVSDFSALENVHFSVVHFNNGMHGWAYSEAQYRSAFPAFVRVIRNSFPGARLIWATTTPVKVAARPGPTNPRVDARNAIAKEFVETDGIPIDDQHALMMNHLDAYQDTVHFNEKGADIQAAQAASKIMNALY